jgi:creatinine amidohydrolase/Fe(II)-dependent formamide hydrolase-like protein
MIFVLEQQVYKDTVEIVKSAVSANQVTASPEQVKALIDAVYNKLCEIAKTVKN